MLFNTLKVPAATNIESFSQWFDDGYSRKNSGEKKTARLKNAQWLWSNWLEVWLADQLTNAKTDDGKSLFHEVSQNVEVGTEPDKFEMDVVAVRGYRVFLFSCTVDSKNHVKSKLFEAANRTARIGGDHARAGLVSLHERPYEVLQTVREEHWQGYDTLRLFGEPHVKGEQAPCNVEPGTTESRKVTLLEGIRQWVLW